MVSAGRLSHFQTQWKNFASDQVLSWIGGVSIPFYQLPLQQHVPNQQISDSESKILSPLISELLRKGAIENCEHEQGEYISSFFAVQKSSGNFRFVLNLKGLNKFVNAPHFKLSDFRTTMRLISSGDYMTSIDLKDAYYLLSVVESDRKYLRFQWKGELYQFTCIPFGLNCAPYIFTKIMRCAMEQIRSYNIVSQDYLDDILCVSNSYRSLATKTKFVISYLESLGFIINFQKSVIIPSQSISYLGFKLCSKTMTVSLPEEKVLKVRKRAKELLERKNCKVRELAKAIGLFVSTRYAVPYCLAYTKCLERCKFLCLNGTQDYERIVSLGVEAKNELCWWSSTARFTSPIRSDSYHSTIYSDASKTGWGAKCGSLSTHGWWNDEEKDSHINWLELKAALFGLQSFSRNLKDCQILLRIDNSTAISYINRMGGIKHSHLSRVSREIWNWCESRNIWIYASYIPSKQNSDADAESRLRWQNTEWELNEKCFSQIKKLWGPPDVDLFASRSNSKCKKFASWIQDPESSYVDAFTIDWQQFKLPYLFPPFNLVGRVIQKIKNDQVSVILVAPLWKTQSWFPSFVELIHSHVLFGPEKELLLSPSRSSHPLHRKLILVAALLSAKPLEERMSPQTAARL